MESVVSLPFAALEELLLRVAVVCLWVRHRVGTLRERLLRRVRRVRRRFMATLVRLGFAPPVPYVAWGRARRNRTPADIEEALCRLHVERPDLGLRGLRVLLARTVGVSRSPSTVRAILIRCRDTLAGLEARRKTVPRRIHVSCKLSLWGIDFTLVFLFGVWPVWLLGVIDYHGSRLLLLEPAPHTGAAVVEALGRLFEKYGVPDRLLSDNGTEFVNEDVDPFLHVMGVTHVRTKPAHPWTNGRIERLFRTAKETKRLFSSIFVGRRHLQRFCDDFLVYYNECRFHASCWGLTPDEVYRGEVSVKPSGQVELFDGRLVVDRFG